MEAPRSLKIEPPSVGSDDEALDVNSFPKTIVQQKQFSLIEGKENIRSYQKPFQAKESEYHHALAVYAFSHRSKRDQPLNPNTIQTFCGLCGTQLVWKPHHKKDAHPLLHVNVHCLKSNWIPLPETEHNLVQHKSAPPPKKTVVRDLQKSRDSSGELSTIPSTLSSATSSVRSEQSFSNEEKKPAYNGASAIVSPSEEEGFDKSKNDHTDGSSSHCSRSRFSVAESDTIHGPLEQKFHSIVSVEGEEMDRSVCSETASTVTTSSMSMTSGWRLRDPNGVWNTMGSAPSSGSKISLEHRLSDRDSQDALLFQMRKHLANHTSPRNSLPKPLYSDEEVEESESQNNTNEDEMSTANSVADVPSTPLKSKSQATPMSSTNKTLFSNGTRRLKAGFVPTPATTPLIDDDASASVVSAADHESLSYTCTYEPPSIFFNKLLRPTR